MGGCTKGAVCPTELAEWGTRKERTMGMKTTVTAGRVNKKKKASSQGNQPFKKPRMAGFNAHAKAIGATTTIGPEWKNLDTTAALTSGAAATWSAVTALNLIAQGAGLQQHVGRKIAITKIVHRFSAVTNSSSGSVRVLIVYDNHANGALPVITDILTNDAFTAVQNLDNSDRFMVLADFYPFEDNGVTPQSLGVGGKKVLKYKQPLLTQFNNTTTATISAIQNGSILIAVCALGSPSASNYTHFTRVRFIDN